MPDHPVLIQGGMGAGVSGWQLARAVSQLGHLGVVAGTALDAILARRLQLGDPDGDLRRAIGQFPDAGIAERILKRYYIAGGKDEDKPFRDIPMYSMRPARRLLELTVLANFVEVYLAKEGHTGKVGVNYLEKIQSPNLASLYGAMLAGVDYVLMGAGIPREIPDILDRFATHQAATLKIAVTGEQAGEDFQMRFDPPGVVKAPDTPLQRPLFLAIIASTTLAMALRKRATGRVDGFIVEGPIAGGHNAPPRGAMRLDEHGEPIYGAKDEVDLEKIRRLGRPFWLAGAYGRAGGIERAQQLGAVGVQVGTPFAFCRESGLTEPLRQELLARVHDGTLKVLTDPLASPTGFPFKVVELEETMSDPAAYAERERGCDLGYLRTAYRRDDGTVGYRCAAEKVVDYVRKGGSAEECTGRRCLCNGLVANIGLGQVRRDGYHEPPILTSGSDLSVLEPLLRTQAAYSAADVVRELTGAVPNDL